MKKFTLKDVLASAAKWEVPEKRESKKPVRTNPVKKEETNQNSEQKEPIKDYKAEFKKTFNSMAPYKHRFQVWEDFIVLSACSLSNRVDGIHYAEREKMYLERIKTYKKEDVNKFADLLALLWLEIEKNPRQDVLGELFMVMDFGDNTKGQVFTPYSVCQLMALLTGGDVKKIIDEKGYVGVCDECCGSGALLIAKCWNVADELKNEHLIWQNHTLVVGQDIDMIAGLMAYIQLSIIGAAGYIKIGNSLTDPIKTGDKLDNYWFMPMFFNDVWRMRVMFHKADELLKEKPV